MKTKLSILALLLCVQAILAQSSITPGTFRIDPPTVHCLGFRWAVSGDADLDGQVAMEYRENGETTWKQGLNMLRQDGQDRAGGSWQIANMFAGSILNLDENTEYEVKITMTDPDNGSSWTSDTTVTVTTNSYPPAFVGGPEVHVYPSTFSGTKLTPNYSSIETAGNAAAPGTRILIHGGVHAGTSAMVLNGTKANPIVFHGVGDGEVILDGGTANPGLSSDPIIAIRYSKHVIIENITIRNGWGIDAVGVEGLVLRNCNLYNVWHGIVLGSGSTRGRDCFIMNNKIKGVNVPWYPRISVPGDAQGVATCGRNIVVCFNDISDVWDGIAPGYPGTPADRSNPFVVSIDIYNNYLYNCMDDHIETDYAHSNIRVWNNLCVNAEHGMSAQPVFGGPIYFFRNFAFNCKEGPLKFHNQPTGLEVYNNTFVAGFNSSAGWMNGTLRNNLFLDDVLGWLVMATGSPDDRSSLDYNGYLDTTFSSSAYYIKWSTPETPRGYYNVPDVSDFYDSSGHEEHGLRIGYPELAHVFDPGEGITYDTSDFDFRIVSSASKAIDRACSVPTITDDYAGAAPDMGAHEYGTALPHFGIYAGDTPPVAVQRRNWSPTSLKLRRISNGMLVSAFPNPFRESVVIRALAGNAIRSLRVYDVMGRMVYSNEKLKIENGKLNDHQVWDGVDNYGRKVANGNYFIKVNTTKGIAMPKINIVR